ncbi:flavin reductase family protein [uncultured Tateyamaria sp.]|uniref:flavin reductase family protein n=1 Tax=uncultured Tateyamaria sp. TaxID=455651 RepID=UPI00263105BA|nr:flavin reductase family protein [uncultured Tateyamaria sp.]
MTHDAQALRVAFGRFMTGVTIVTSRRDDGAPIGFTANSFTSVSLDPPLLLVCPGQHLSSYPDFQTTNHFAVSILAEGQEDVSNRFASSKADRFGPGGWSSGHADMPLIDGRAAGFVCEVFERVPAGDHTVLIGRVVDFDANNAPGLGYGPDGYFALGQERRAEAPAAKHTRACVLLDDGQHIYLTAHGDLPSVQIGPDASPLQGIEAHLATQHIKADLGVVYALYDQDDGGREIVFRGHVATAPAGLTQAPIATATAADPALDALLKRFAQEHKTQAFGLYVGSNRAGDVLRADTRG